MRQHLPKSVRIPAVPDELSFAVMVEKSRSKTPRFEPTPEDGRTVPYTDVSRLPSLPNIRLELGERERNIAPGYPTPLIAPCTTRLIVARKQTSG